MPCDPLPEPAPINLSRRRFGAVLPALGLGLIGVGWLAGCAAPNTAPEHASALSSVPPFSSAHDGGPLPDGWSQYIMRPDRAHTDYSIARRDGRNVLHAVANSA